MDNNKVWTVVVTRSASGIRSFEAAPGCEAFLDADIVLGNGDDGFPLDVPIDVVFAPSESGYVMRRAPSCAHAIRRENADLEYADAVACGNGRDAALERWRADVAAIVEPPCGRCEGCLPSLLPWAREAT